MAESKEQELSVDAFGVKGRMKNYRLGDVALVVLICAVILFGYMLWEHKAEASAQAAIKVTAQQEMAASLRLISCLLSIPHDQRGGEFANEASFCAKMSKLK